MTRMGFLLPSVATLTIGFGGCIFGDPGQRAGVQTNNTGNESTAQTESATQRGADAGQYAPGRHPMLAAAPANRINMFGEMENGARGEYFSRSALSLRQHTHTEVGGDSDPHLDSQGKRIVFASTRHNTAPDLYIKAVDGVAVTQLTSDPSADVQPAFSPDNTKVAFASNRGGNWDIWIIGVGGGQPVQVTSGLANEVHPSWSSDGRELVYCSLSNHGGQWELWIVDAAAGGTPRFIGYGLFPEWSPKENVIVYQRARERGSNRFSIWTLTLIDGEPRYPTELAASPDQAMILPTWSRDGLSIAFSGTHAMPPDPGSGMSDTETFDVWMMRADGRGRIRLTDGYAANYAPTFSPDGRVYFTSNRTARDNVWSQRPAGPNTVVPPRDLVTQQPAPNPGMGAGADAGMGANAGNKPQRPATSAARVVVDDEHDAGDEKSSVSGKRTSDN